MPASLSLVAPHSEAPELLRVLVADARPWVRAGMRALLERDAGIVVVGEAASPGQVVAFGQALGPDVLLTGSPALAAEPLRGVATLVLDDEHTAALGDAVRRAARRRRTPQLEVIQGGSSWNCVI
jgi:DNA-binding NarL/FixJ family response regulator